MNKISPLIFLILVAVFWRMQFGSKPFEQLQHVPDFDVQEPFPSMAMASRGRSRYGPTKRGPRAKPVFPTKPFYPPAPSPKPKGK